MRQRIPHVMYCVEINLKGLSGVLLNVKHLLMFWYPDAIDEHDAVEFISLFSKHNAGEFTSLEGFNRLYNKHDACVVISVGTQSDARESISSKV